jgi:EAL domain-containing protein (putative c-di-GMP-specific phosphodiesterase class I)
LALDDFGNGHSSLRHLQMLPFDKIKVDASFVQNMCSSAESHKIVAAVIGLGRNLGLLTVAEGIEDANTATALRDLGCHIGQGWMFGRPSATAAAGVLAPPLPTAA